ncbi:MAG: hypothetical protein AB7S26_05965 [Sandaracinaceae bacterium]
MGRRSFEAPPWLARLAPLAAVIALAAVYYAAPLRQVTDSRCTLMISESILTHGTVDLGWIDWDHQRDVEGLPPTLYREGPHVFHYFPEPSAFLSVPLVLALRLVGMRAIDAAGQVHLGVEEEMQAILASLLTALTVLVIYRTARLRIGRAPSLGLAVVMALGTPLLSTLSRALWSSTWAALLLSVGLYAALAPGRPSRRAMIVGSAVALTVCVRPGSIFCAAAVFAVMVLAMRREPTREPTRLPGWALGGIVALGWLALFVGFSWVAHGSIVPGYYVPDRFAFGSVFRVALLGTLVSPGRGLFVFCPFLVVVLVARGPALLRGERAALLLGLGAHVLLVASFWHWWGGHSYGPRLHAETMPLWALLAVDVIRGLEHRSPIGRFAIVNLGASLGLLSMLIHLPGATMRDTWAWNALPLSVDIANERLWDPTDLQFLAGLRPREPAPPPPVQLEATVLAAYWGHGRHASWWDAPGNEPIEPGQPFVWRFDRACGDHLSLLADNNDVYRMRAYDGEVQVADVEIPMRPSEAGGLIVRVAAIEWACMDRIEVDAIRGDDRYSVGGIGLYMSLQRWLEAEDRDALPVYAP